MPKSKSEDILDNEFLHHQGYSPELIELPESAVFPALILSEPSTARKSRVTGILLGEPAPRFVHRGRNVRYRLFDADFQLDARKCFLVSSRFRVLFLVF